MWTVFFLKNLAPPLGQLVVLIWWLWSRCSHTSCASDVPSVLDSVQMHYVGNQFKGTNESQVPHSWGKAFATGVCECFLCPCDLQALLLQRYHSELVGHVILIPAFVPGTSATLLDGAWAWFCSKNAQVCFQPISPGTPSQY